MVKMETILISKEEYKKMKKEVQVLRSSKIYKRLLEFEKNILRGKVCMRKDLGF